MKKKTKQPKTKDKLHNLLLEIDQKYGKNTIRFAKDEPVKEKLPTGIKSIDEFIGGGFVRGMFSIIYGAKGVAKSTLSYVTIANLQKEGKMCLLIDMEHSYDENYAIQCGIDSSKLLILTADTAEEVMDVVIKISKTKLIAFIVLDSMQALAPTEEMETKKHKELSMSDDQVAAFAKKMGKFLRVIAPFIYKSKIGFLFIGQTRIKGIGTFFAHEGLTGGNAVLHWTSIIIHMQRGMKANSPYENVKENYIDKEGKERTRTTKRIIGFPCALKIEKTKVFGTAIEGSRIIIPFYSGKGFNVEKEKKADE